MQRISTAFQKIKKFTVSRNGLILIGIITLACVIRPELAALVAAMFAGLFATVAMVALTIAGIAAMLAIFPGCLILPFWLAGRSRRKLEARIAQLEGREKPPT